MTEANTRRRVKLYMLNDERQWDDKGTGHVSALYTEQNNIALVVISENDGSCLLESKIHPETAYQKQQETLIVWSEGDNMDLALSFQEKAGCEDIWEKICTVQGKDPSVDITQDVVDESDDADDVESYTINPNQSLQTFELPPCELSRLEEIAELISQTPAALQRRERLVAAFERTNYIRQLIDLFHKAEDLEDMESLHHLYEIIRQLILFNKQILYEILFSDDIIMDVVGILEYNPAGRIRHRDFLRNQATFREVLPLHNTDLVNKIHQTYRVQYIQDCCLPPPCLFDEHTMSVLKSFISLNKIDIISALQDDEEFMLQLFACLKSPETSDSHRRELALFVKEFCNLSVQTEQKENFLNCLFSHGALTTVEVLLTYEDRDVKAAALEILQAFVENQPSVVREYVCRDNPPRRDEHILINLMITQLLNDPDPELNDAFQLGYMLRILIDPENMNNTSGRSEKTEFLSFFYKRCIGTLAKPLFDNTVNDEPLHDNYHLALVLNNVLELLTFCMESHSYHMKNYCLHRDLVKRVLVLLRSTHKFLVLCALRLLRRVVNMKEEFYNRYLMKNCLFKPVIDLFLANGHKYNMIDSAVIELFDFIHTENINSLVVHIVEKYWDILKNINYVQTFSKLKERYDVSHRPIRTGSPNVFVQHANANAIPLRTVTNIRTRVTTEFDDEEEQWFGQDDEEDEEEPAPIEGLHHISPGSPNTGLLPNSATVATAIVSPLDALSAEVPTLLSNSLSPQRLPLTDAKSDKSIIERSPPSYALLPFSDKNISECVDSPLPKPGLIRQHTSISIHIKSTTLNGGGVEGEIVEVTNTAAPENNENEVENVASSIDVASESLKFVQANDTEKNNDNHNSDEEMTDPKPTKLASKRLINKATSNKHSKRPALVATSMENSPISEEFPNGHQSTIEQLVKAASNDRPESVVGLVDYSDEESDEDASPEDEKTKDSPLSDVLPPTTLPPIQSDVNVDENDLLSSHLFEEQPLPVHSNISQTET